MTIRTISQTVNQRASGKTASQSYKRRARRALKAHRKQIIRYSLITANVALLVAVIGFVVKSPNTSQAIKQSAFTSDVVAASPLDQLSSSDIAVHVAQMASLPESTAVVNQADTISNQIAVSSADSRVISKPQVVSTEAKSYLDITTYVAKAGDTVPKIAAKFGVTSDSIRWSNGLDGDQVATGRVLYIPPINGIVYLVKAGDTVEGLAREFNASKEAIAAFNDTDFIGLKPGRRVVIPDGIERSAVVVTSFAESSAPSSSWRAAYGSNGYDYGWCTWHAANRRAQIGRPIPNNMGNAIAWLGAAQSAGLATGSLPRAGAVVYHLNIGGWGHVAYVERMNPDGSALVSDMNYPIWGQVTTRTVKPSEFGNYRFIY